MLVVIEQVSLYMPEYVGKKDVLVAAGKIAAVEDKIDLSSLRGVDIDQVDGSGLVMVPGLVDSHVHIAGAGGEGGPATRTGEIPLKELLEAGVSSVVGCLGTDGITRDVRSVLMKVKALRELGLSGWMYTGAYQVPPPSITGDSARDVALIEEVIGAGEIALSDHRSSHPCADALIKLASEVRVAGMLAGKAGIINVHLGDAPHPFQPLYQAVENSQLPLKQFYPTHCNRNNQIYLEAKTYGRKGYLDLTSSAYPYFKEDEVKPSRAVKGLLEAGIPLEHISISSDANGSLPAFDARGNLIRLEKGKPKASLQEIKDMVEQEKIPLEQAIQTVSTTPAAILKLKGKGRLQPGFDADGLLLDRDLNIRYMLANGKMMIKDYQIIRKAHYEE